ncbi:protein-L-isoaspartate(D-aspartate) O-methyltransferase [Rhizomicrobium palustre]|uniref:Protein-L-isoaspartate O-methyltransferase n=1 Tax=Rhizomicrobium palustre TaxID=189966 RepID=A0A846MUR4_9PROT|nr:protein-L-isoaspartate(D-aspartate) O-methyltransferase [Rhizomicrobium palustre]NIK86969.1 protein-L-isoaspartate(D-aspartate) O-methyltransferase [Rhizomicrobium palustre]
MTDPRLIALVMALRKQGITDARVLSAVEVTPREVFVGEAFEHAAYDNSALPIACGQTISQPYVVAMSTLALELSPTHRVLEIGTGSGYQAAVLARLCRRVYSVERHRALHLEAERRFKALKIENIATKLGDGFKGWPEQAPFDRILLTAAVPEVPAALVEQLKLGGILVAPIGEQPYSRPGDVPSGGLESNYQLLTKMIRTETGLKKEALIPVLFVPMLPGVPQEQ